MSERKYIIPHLPLPYDLETKAVLKQLNLANKKLAECFMPAVHKSRRDKMMEKINMKFGTC